jgi:hypothetical protein
MSRILSPLSGTHIQIAMNEAGLQTRQSVIDGTDVPCIVASSEEIEFITYIQQGQSLCFQAIIKSPQAGFRDVASHWNRNRRFSKALTHKEGYYLRFETDIKFGVTPDHLSALVDTFSSSAIEFFGWIQEPGPRSSLPIPTSDSASR